MSKLEVEIKDTLLVDLSMARRELISLTKGKNKYTLPSGVTIELDNDNFHKMVADCVPEAIKNYKLYTTPKGRK